MFASLMDAVMSASPAPTAVMRPVASTVTTSSSEEVHSMVSFEAASAIFSCSALSSVPYSISSCCVSPFSITTFGGNPMELMSTPHPTSDSAIAAAAMTIDMIFFFIFFFCFFSFLGRRSIDERRLLTFSAWGRGRSLRDSPSPTRSDFSFSDSFVAQRPPGSGQLRPMPKNYPGESSHQTRR